MAISGTSSRRRTRIDVVSPKTPRAKGCKARETVSRVSVADMKWFVVEFSGFPCSRQRLWNYSAIVARENGSRQRVNRLVIGSRARVAKDGVAHDSGARVDHRMHDHRGHEPAGDEH